MLKEHILTEDIVFESTHFQIKNTTIDFANGNIGTYQYICFSPNRHTNGSVMVAAIEDKNVYLIEQYHVAVDRKLWVLPRGALPHDISPEQQAQIELQEEIGYRAIHMQFLTQLDVFPGYLKVNTHFFVATGLVPSVKAGDECETISIHKIPLEEAVHWVDTGKITDCRTIAGLLFLKRRVQTHSFLV